MGKAIAYEVGVHGPSHRVLTDDVFQREQDDGGLPVSYPAVRSGGRILPPLASHGIEISHPDIVESLQFPLTGRDATQIHDRGVLPENRIHDFHFGVAVDPLI